MTMFGYFWEKVDIDARICLSPCLVLPIARDEAPTLEHFFKLLRIVNLGEMAAENHIQSSADSRPLTRFNLLCLSSSDCARVLPRFASAYLEFDRGQQ